MKEEEIPFLPQSWIPGCVLKPLLVLGLFKDDAHNADNFLEKQPFICDGHLRRICPVGQICHFKLIILFVQKSRQQSSTSLNHVAK